MTSGGTESIVLACKAYRDRAHAHGIEQPELYAPLPLTFTNKHTHTHSIQTLPNPNPSSAPSPDNSSGVLLVDVAIISFITFTYRTVVLYCSTV